MREIETKISGFDEKKLRKALKEKHAVYMGKKHYRRYVFDMAAESKKGYDEFIRIRTDGKNATLTYKYRKGKRFDSTDEIEVGVDDFEGAARIIYKLWKGKKAYMQENFVELWKYRGTEIAIATSPIIPKFLEIEGKSVAAVQGTIKDLGIDGKILGNLSYGALFTMFKHKGKDQGDLKF